MLASQVAGSYRAAPVGGAPAAGVSMDVQEIPEKVQTRVGGLASGVVSKSPSAASKAIARKCVDLTRCPRVECPKIPSCGENTRLSGSQTAAIVAFIACEAATFALAYSVFKDHSLGALGVGSFASVIVTGITYIIAEDCF